MSCEAESSLTTEVDDAGPAGAVYSGLRFIELDKTWRAEIYQLEQNSFPNPWPRTVFDAEFAKEVSYRPAIVRDGKLVAQSFNHIVEDELHILNLSVDSRDRRRGYGSMLLAYILQEAAGRGVRYASLEVRVGNYAAQRLYAKFGFRHVAMRKRYYRDNFEDALTLRLVFDHCSRLPLNALARRME